MVYMVSVAIWTTLHYLRTHVHALAFIYIYIYIYIYVCMYVCMYVGRQAGRQVGM